MDLFKPQAQSGKAQTVPSKSTAKFYLDLLCRLRTGELAASVCLPFPHSLLHCLKRVGQSLQGQSRVDLEMLSLSYLLHFSTVKSEVWAVSRFYPACATGDEHYITPLPKVALSLTIVPPT